MRKINIVAKCVTLHTFLRELIFILFSILAIPQLGSGSLLGITPRAQHLTA